MTKKQPTKLAPKDSSNRFSWYCLLLLLIVACYQNTLQAGWHFDDIANILLNTPLHLHSLTFSSLKETFFAYPQHPGKFLRPVSNLSFGLNWLIGQDNVLGYHLVNICIHLTTGILLYHTIILLLSSPAVKNKYKSNQHIIAVIAATLWAVNPVQTQAITYIVQRMASLAALFYLAAILCYLKARLSPSRDKQSFLFYGTTFLFYLLAIGSKENAVLFPASIVLIELFFFQKSLRVSKQTALLCASGLALVITFTLILVGPGFFTSILSSYESRNFTFLQRILTESRIMVFYISLLFFPAPSRMSITHDLELSTSLFTPATTFPSILFLLLLTFLPFFYHKKYPLLSFSILFFLLNHIVESTIIPLEMLFEHRNYLPSFFLFLPIAAGFSLLLDRYQKQRKVLYVATILCIAGIISLFSLGTITRNRVWHDEESLWSDSLKKAPKSARSYINLAHYYIFKEKNYKKAFELNFISLSKFSPTPWKDTLRAYNNMGYIMTRIGNYPQAVTFFDKALTASQALPTDAMNTTIMATKSKALWLSGKRNAAIQVMKDVIDTVPTANSAYLQHYAEMLTAEGHTNQALEIFHQALLNSHFLDQTYNAVLLDISLIYSKKGNHQKSDFFAALARQLYAPLVPYAFCRMESNIRAGRKAKADKAIEAILSHLTWPQFIAIVEEKDPERPTAPLDYPLLRHYTRNWLAAQKK